MEPVRANALRAAHPSRLASGHPRLVEIMHAHEVAVARGLPSYRDPVTGYQVFTAAFLIERGTCCESGCRHCPFVGADDPAHTDG
jgi:hypothetical protein